MTNSASSEGESPRLVSPDDGWVGEGSQLRLAWQPAMPETPSRADLYIGTDAENPSKGALIHKEFLLYPDNPAGWITHWTPEADAERLPAFTRCYWQFTQAGTFPWSSTHITIKSEVRSLYLTKKDYPFSFDVTSYADTEHGTVAGPHFYGATHPHALWFKIVIRNLTDETIRLMGRAPDSPDGCPVLLVRKQGNLVGAKPGSPKETELVPVREVSAREVLEARELMPAGMSGPLSGSYTISVGFFVEHYPKPQWQHCEIHLTPKTKIKIVL